MTRKIRSNTPAAAVRAAQAAAQPPIAPPGHVDLRPCDLPYWVAVVKARPADSWNDSDLSAAAHLARCRADLERLQREVAEEGDVVPGPKGNLVANPKHQLIDQTARRALAFARALRVDAVATVGRSSTAANFATAHRQAAAASADGIDDHYLIPQLGCSCRWCARSNGLETPWAPKPGKRAVYDPGDRLYPPPPRPLKPRKK